MALPELSRREILQAVAEYDRLGQDRFLEKYGFGPARSYRLVVDGKTYDSKAIVGASHGYLPDHNPLVAADFSGGAATVGRLLSRLGFQVTQAESFPVAGELIERMPDAARRNPDWEWDVTVLACDLVFQNDWQPLPPEDQRVIELSVILQRMSLHPPEARTPSFRNEDGVARKTHNLASAAPDWGKWRSNGSERDHEVMGQFQAAPDVMHQIAEELLQDALTDTPENASKFEGNDDGSVLEGRYLWRFHAERERNQGLRRKKIRSVLHRGDPLACEACGFDFGQIYGDRGQGYIECHHVQPLHETGERDTKISDLSLLCSNCHRMIHRKPPYPTPAQLRDMMKASR